MIAFVGPNLPQDLLIATGRFAGPIGWNIDREMPAAARWLENKFPLWCWSVIEDWAAGAFDHLDAVLFSRADDSAQRLYYYLCELQRQGEVKGPEPIVFDVAKISRSSSEAHTIASVRGLASRFGLDDAALERGIAGGNARRLLPVAAAPAGPVCLIAGSPPPDRRIHAMIESAGWSAAGDTLDENWSRLGPAIIQESADPAEAIGRHSHALCISNRAYFDRGGELVAKVAALNAAAVVLWYAEEEEAQVWHLPGQQLALREAGIPHIALTRRDWRCNDGLDVEIGQFIKECSA